MTGQYPIDYFPTLPIDREDLPPGQVLAVEELHPAGLRNRSNFLARNEHPECFSTAQV